MFDKTHLPQALFEFVVISDTHYMLDMGNQPLEFESRRKQTQRSEIALAQVAALNPLFVIHLGDLVQEYPETPDFEQAVTEARAQLKRCGVSPYFVAGNHDVGDKTDNTMPTHPASAESLAYFHENFGPSWQSFDHENCHFILLNSQILNADLPETQEQWTWLETDLQTHQHKRIFLFFHLPLYLNNLQEPGLGHYDNINPPDRERLHKLVENYNLELVFAGHIHYPFYDHIGKTRYIIAPSPAFTRPGFGHLFPSSPPPERGRDDKAKLGFYFVRVFEDRTDIHFQRTHGAETQHKHPRLVTGTSATLPNSPIGLTLGHPITPTAEVPLAYPSAVRTAVRNDLHLLSAIELGATSVRFPWRDLLNPFLRTRLEMLKSEGISLTATFLEPRTDGLSELINTHTHLVDTWEVQLPGTIIPTESTSHTLQHCQNQTKLSLCPIISNERVPGKQHLRTRTGYTPEEIPEINAFLQKNNIQLSRILCRIPPDLSPSKVITELPTTTHIAQIDLSVELSTQNDFENAARTADACVAIALHPNTRLFLSPYNDLDRTMDAIHGLLDTLSNPRPAFHVLRHLNTLLFSPVHDVNYQLTADTDTPTYRAIGLKSQERALTLILPKTPETDPKPGLQGTAFNLETGEILSDHSGPTLQGPYLIIH